MDAWLRDVPPITRSWVLLCILTTIAVVRTFSVVCWSLLVPQWLTSRIAPVNAGLVANRNRDPVAAVFQLQVDCYECPGRRIPHLVVEYTWLTRNTAVLESRDQLLLFWTVVI